MSSGPYGPIFRLEIAQISIITVILHFNSSLISRKSRTGKKLMRVTLFNICMKYNIRNKRL